MAPEYPPPAARLGTGAGRDYRTFPVIAASSRVCTPKLGDLLEAERRATGSVREEVVVQAVDELRGRPRASGCTPTLAPVTLDLEIVRGNVAAARSAIDEAAARAGRPAGAVELLAATKYVAAEDMPVLAEAGIE